MEYQAQVGENALSSITPLLSDDELAQILRRTLEWVRCHATEIPGHERLGMYYRFHVNAVERWLGSLDPVLTANEVAGLLKVPRSWVYANADEIPGVLRLGRYVCFRPAVIKLFLGGPETCQ